MAALTLALDDKQHAFEPVDQLALTARSVLINTPLQADSGTRTRDPHFTRVVLYQLS